MGAQRTIHRFAHRIGGESHMKGTTNRSARYLAFILALLLIAMAIAPIAAAGNHSNARDKQAEVSQRPPSAGPPDLSDNDDSPGEAGVHVQPTAGSDRSVSLSSTVADDNGHNDIAGVSVTVYAPDNTTQHIATFPASKASGTGKQAVFNALFDMSHHDPPGTYYVKVEATDRDGQTSISWTEFIFEELSAITVAESTVTLNPDGNSESVITPGNDTRETPSIVAFTNAGNVPINAELSGTDLTNIDASATLPVSSIVYSQSDTFDPETALSEAAEILTLNLSPGASSSVNIYFAIDIPLGLPADTYNGTMTLSAIKAT